MAQYLESLQSQLPLQHHEANRGPVPVLARPDLVVYPGTSSRRRALFEHVFPGQAFMNVPIGEEPKNADIGDVMKFKLREALPQLPPGERCVAVIAADTQNITPVLDRQTGEPRMISRSKPSSPDEVFAMFRDMHAFAEGTNQNPFYIGDSSSGMLHLNGSAHLVEDRKRTAVELKPAEFAKLAEVDGFIKYLTEFARFYSQPPYSTHNMEVDITNLSAGISLPVLVKMGIVSSIDGVDRWDKGFRDKLMEGVNNVAVGISPRVLESAQVPQDALAMWPWLNGVVDSAMSP